MFVADIVENLGFLEAYYALCILHTKEQGKSKVTAAEQKMNKGVQNT